MSFFGGCCCSRNNDNCWDPEQIDIDPRNKSPEVLPAEYQRYQNPVDDAATKCRDLAVLNAEPQKEKLSGGDLESNATASVHLGSTGSDRLADHDSETCDPTSRDASPFQRAQTEMPSPSRTDVSSPRLHRPHERCGARQRSDSAPVSVDAEELLSPSISTRRHTCSAVGPRACRLFTEEGNPQTPPLSGAVGEPQGPDPEEEEVDREGESWSSFLTRASAVLAEADVKEEPAALFETFRTTDDIGLAYAAFARLFYLAVAPGETVGRRRSGGYDMSAPWDNMTCRMRQFPYQEIRVLLGGNWKAKQLWKVLDARVARPEYAKTPCGRGRLQGQHCLVVGAGPCGLRAAIELRLLGARVSIVEQRVRFSRINQLHIWSWVGEDIKGLGARCMEPPPASFAANPDLLHITINDLQKFLLKVALLLGVEVLLGVEYVGTHWDGCGWTAKLRESSSACACTEGRAGPTTLASFVKEDGPPSAAAPGRIERVGVLVGSGGFASDIAQEVGIGQVETEHLRRESAIGLVCNLARANGKCEGGLRSFSMARQFYNSLFRQAQEATGADLENIVYVKSHAAHYFVMTPTPKCLRETGVVVNGAHEPLLARENIDEFKLDELVRRVAAFPFKKDQLPVLEAITRDLAEGEPIVYADSGPRLFDFSKMRRSQEGLKIQPPPGQGDAKDEDCLLTCLVGDSLIEPFWPEGLGIIRGFFGVLDACSAVEHWSTGSSRAEVAQHYDQAYQKLKTLGAATRAAVLHEQEGRYALAPSSRYR